MAEEKDTAAPAKRTAGKTGRRKKPEAEHAARAAPQDKDTGSKAQDILEQARTEPKPEWEVAEQVVLLPLDRLRPFKNHPFKVNDEDELMQDTIDSIMAGGVINPILFDRQRMANLKSFPGTAGSGHRSLPEKRTSKPSSGKWTTIPP